MIAIAIITHRQQSKTTSEHVALALVIGLHRTNTNQHVKLVVLESYSLACEERWILHAGLSVCLFSLPTRSSLPLPLMSTSTALAAQIAECLGPNEQTNPRVPVDHVLTAKRKQWNLLCMHRHGKDAECAPRSCVCVCVAEKDACS